MKRAAALLLFSMFFSSAALAARPLGTDDAGTVDKGHFEMEMGFEFLEDTDKEYTTSTVLKYGILDSLDVGTEIPYHYIEVHDQEDVHDLGDITFCAKYRLLEQDQALPAVSFVAEVKTTSGEEDKGLGNSMIDYGLTLVATREFDNGAVHLNLGYGYAGIPEIQKYDRAFSYGLAGELSVTENLNLVAECLGETNFDGDFNDNPFVALVGFNYSLCEWASFDFGAGAGISKASPDYYLTTGITVAF